jgi:hypothetical protein
MKLVIATAIIAILGGIQAWAQTPTGGLADVARQERERRAGGAGAVRVITTETANTNRNGIPIVVGKVGEVLPDEAAPAEPAEAAGAAGAGGEITSIELDDAAAAIAQQQRVVQDLEDQEVRYQLEMNRFRGEYLAPVVSQRDRDAALQGMNAAQASLESVQVRLADARETLAALVAAAEAEAAGPPAQAAQATPSNP